MLDDISFPHDGRDLHLFQDDVETCSWSGCVADTLVRGDPRDTIANQKGGLYGQ